MKIILGKTEILIDQIPSWFKEYSWYVTKLGYVRGKKRNKNYALHRLLLGLEKRDGKIVDHINRNPSDNRKENLRLVNFSQSGANRSSRLGKYRGIYSVFVKGKTYWRVQLEKQIDGKRVRFNGGKTFATREEGLPLAKELRKKVYGEYDTDI